MEKMEKNNFSEQTKIIQIDGKSFMYTCLSKGFANIDTTFLFLFLKRLRLCSNFKFCSTSCSTMVKNNYKLRTSKFEIFSYLNWQIILHLMCTNLNKSNDVGEGSQNFKSVKVWFLTIKGGHPNPIPCSGLQFF